MSADRIGGWGCTASGRAYWPEDPRPEDLSIGDIAHALSLQCRFGGHCSGFYSVAQHSVHVSEVCDPEDALWGLLHDASEAYLVDIPRPAKLAVGMEGYLVLERAMMRAVCDRWGLSYDIPASVRAADEILLATEARDLMPQGGPAGVPRWSLTHEALRGRLELWHPARARRAFLDRFDTLTAKASAA